MSDSIEMLCTRCSSALDFDFSHALQPIVDVEAGEIYAYEALARAPDGQGGAAPVLARVNDANRYRFDQASRVKAIQLAARLGLSARLSINFLPNAVYQPENCIQATLAAARACDFPLERIIFEVTEAEQVADKAHLKNVIDEYQRQGFLTAIDDFGAGYAGLNLLAEFQPDIIKLDREVLQALDQDPARRAIVRSIVSVCDDLEILPIAEGVETAAEFDCLRDTGITHYQGYLFARPAFEALPALPAERLSGLLA